jgi:hypothetical protein
MLHLVNLALSAAYTNITGGKSPPARAPLRSVPARNGAVPELIEVLEIAGVAAVNASLAFIEGAKAKGEVECALVKQMACTHAAAMAVLGRVAGGKFNPVGCSTIINVPVDNSPRPALSHHYSPR